MKSKIQNLIGILIIIVIILIAFNVRIMTIDIVGNTKYQNEEIENIIFSGALDRISIVAYIKDKFVKHIKIKYVDSYEIIWNNPIKITIDIYEKQPVAFVKRDIKKAYFDDDGMVLDIIDDKEEDITEVVGFNFKRVSKGDKLILENETQLEDMLFIMSTIRGNNYTYEVLELTQDEEYRLYINKVIVELGNGENMNIKLKRLNDIMPTIIDLNGTLNLKDVKENPINEQYIFKKNE